MTKIIVLQNNESDLTLKVVQSIKFMAQMIGFAIDVQVSEKNDFDEDAIVLLHLDATIMNELQPGSKLSQAFSKHKGVCIVVSFGYLPEKMPQCLNNAHVYQYLQTPVLHEAESISMESSLDIMAHDVVYFLMSFADVKSKRYTLFLGAPDADVADEFQSVLRESLHRGFNVLPKIINPTANMQLSDKQALWKQLDNCQLAVHFISHKMLEHYPENLGPAMQLNHLVAEYCHEPGHESLKRIIFITPEDFNTNSDTSHRIAEFKNDSYNLKNAELVQVPLERLKNILVTRYYEWANPQNTDNGSFDAKPMYLVFPPKKEENVIEICKWLDDNNISYAKSQIDLDQLDLLRYHEAMMTSCDGVLLYNDGNEQWLMRKVSDLVKSPGWGRKSEFKYVVILGNNLSESCKNAINKEYDIIDLTGVTDYNKLKKIISD